MSLLPWPLLLCVCVSLCMYHLLSKSQYYNWGQDAHRGVSSMGPSPFALISLEKSGKLHKSISSDEPLSETPSPLHVF